MLKIFHTSDIQIEIRRNSQRYDEYKSALDEMFKRISTDLDIKIVSIVGDLFEFCQVTETERNMITSWVRSIEELPHITEVVIASGNHDLKQRFNDIQISGENVIEDSVMTSLQVTFEDSKKVQVFTASGFYPSVADPKLSWGIWAHEHKFDGKSDFYNPWERYPNTSADNVIELYHDDFSGALNFNGQTQKGCENASGFTQFKAKTILAGHIHNPQQFKENDQTFTYASSPVMRDFGEGDYYINANRTVNGQGSHGYYIHEVDPNNSYKTEKSEFIPLSVHTTRATINIDQNFNYDDIEMLKIRHVSPFKNLIRLNVFGAITQYHANSAKIIAHLRSQCENLEITENVDSSSIFSDSTEDLDVELDKLVTEDQIIDIAIPYIKRRIRDTKKILPEDKERAEIETIDMFKAQLSKLRRNTERNSVRFGSLKVSNFLSYGDGIEIDFRNLKNLVKISGTNGIGKTNIMKLIKWIVDDVIDSSQARNTTNQNALDVFNDKRMDQNTVDAVMTFDCNNKQYILTKTIEREFKSRVKEEINVKNWKEHIKSVKIAKTLTIRAIDGEQTLTDQDLITTELQAIFGNVSDMESLLFTNATLLDRLVKSDPNALADQIMHILGLRYFQDMAAEYDTLRKEKLADLPKPSDTIDALTVAIADLKETKNNATHIIGTLEQSSVQYDSDIKQYYEQIGVLRESLHPVTGTAEEISQKITQTETLITVDRSTIETKEAENKTLEERLIVESENFDEQIEQIIREQGEITKVGDALKNDLDIAFAKLDQVKENVKTVSAQVKSDLLLEISNKYQAQTADLNQKLTDLNKTKTEVLEKLTSNKHAHELERSTKRAEIESILTAAKNALTEANTKLQTDTSMLAVYKNSTKCKECGQDIVGEALKEIEQRIKEREVAISETNVKISALKTEIEKAESELQAPLFTTDINTWLTENHGESISEAKELSIQIKTVTDEIEAQKEKQSQEEQGVTDKIKDDPKVKQAIADYQVSNNSYNELSTKLTEQRNLELDKRLDADNRLTAVRERKTNYGRIGESIKTNTDFLSDINNRIRESDNILRECRDNLCKLEENKLVKVKIDEIDAKLIQTQALKNENANELTSFKIKVEEAKTGIERREKDMIDLVNYRIMESSLSIYKSFIGKQGINKLIFDAVSKKLNVHMNDLLEDSPYKLAFVDGVLKLIDSNDAQNPVTRTASAFSGMQIILGGLSLFYVLRNASLGTKYDCVFIDEVSGPLNDGKDLSYKAVDYKQLLVRMINKMTESTRVLIVEHYLDFDSGSVLEVFPTPQGADIKLIA